MLSQKYVHKDSLLTLVHFPNVENEPTIRASLKKNFKTMIDKQIEERKSKFKFYSPKQLINITLRNRRNRMFHYHLLIFQRNEKTFSALLSANPTRSDKQG